MSDKMKIEERQRICIGLLRRFPERFILIGGYATSAFEFPRFSVDLDIVIKNNDLWQFRNLLRTEGFNPVQETGHFSETYNGQFIRFEKRVNDLPVSVDLLVDMVQSRQTGIGYSFDYLWKNSEIRRIIGVSVREYTEARVAGREMLIALKIHSVRKADQRDIIALCSGNLDNSKIIKHLERVPRDVILSHTNIILQALRDPNSKDSIKGVFGISDDVYEKIIERARRELSLIKETLG